MGQIFDRIKNISSSYVNDSKFADFSIIDDEDEELKRIIDELDKKKEEKSKSNQNNSTKSSFKATNKSIYETLGVNINSTKEEVSSAYKNLLKQYHPDKVANLGKELQDLAILKTKDINLAYQQIKKEKQW